MRLTKVLALGAAMCGMMAGAAQAQTIYIGVGPQNSITDLKSGAGVVSFDDGGLTAFTAQGFDFSTGGAGDVASTAVAWTFGGAVSDLQIWVTVIGLDVPAIPAPGASHNFDFASSFTENSLPAGATVTQTTYLDPADAKYGTAIELGSETFTTNGAPPAADYAGNPVVLSGQYSLTELYEITSPASASFLSTIKVDITDLGPRPNVPEPSTWAMLGLGFAGIGFVGYRRQRSARFAL